MALFWHSIFCVCEDSRNLFFKMGSGSDASFNSYFVGNFPTVFSQTSKSDSWSRILEDDYPSPSNRIHLALLIVAW